MDRIMGYNHSLGQKDMLRFFIVSCFYFLPYIFLNIFIVNII
jgi:hypothetical protein